MKKTSCRVTDLSTVNADFWLFIKERKVSRPATDSEHEVGVGAISI